MPCFERSGTRIILVQIELFSRAVSAKERHEIKNLQLNCKFRNFEISQTLAAFQRLFNSKVHF